MPNCVRLPLRKRRQRFLAEQLLHWSFALGYWQRDFAVDEVVVEINFRCVPARVKELARLTFPAHS